MGLIRKFQRIIFKRKMRGTNLQVSRNIFHQILLYLINRKNTRLLKRNRDIKNSSDGGRCFIFFTGTSIADFDFDLIKGEPVIACGMAVVHKDFKKCNVVGYFDPGPWEPRALSYFDFIFAGVYRSTLKGCKIFLHTTAYPYRNEILSYRKQDTYYFTSDGNYLSSEDIKSELHELNNIQEGSLSASLGIASYMGFQEIYLLGADYMTDPVIYGHFWDGYNETANTSDYESYRERGSWMIEHVEKKGCKVINVLKDKTNSSSIESITFQDLPDILK
jgi:hypothetical protein